MRKALELLQVLYGGSVTNHIPYTRAVRSEEHTSELQSH